MSRLDNPNSEIDLVSEAFRRVLGHRQYVSGPEVRELESLLAGWLQTRYAIGCNSGFGAHLLGLLALGIGPGSKIAVPAFAPASYLGALMRRGAVPVLIDVAANDFHMDPLALADRLDNRGLDLVIVYHLFGGTVDVCGILHLTGATPMMEVVTFSLGAHIGERHAGSFGMLSISCLREETTIGAYGDAGMIWTDDQPLSEKLCRMREEDARTDTHEGLLSGCFHQDSVHAGILLQKFGAWRESVKERNQQGALLAHAILEQNVPGVVVPPFYNHNTAHFVVFAEHRDALVGYLRSQGIAAAAWWPVPIFLQPGFRHLRHREGDFPEAERAARMSLWLPLPGTECERDALVARLAGFYASYRRYVCESPWERVSQS